MDTKNIKDEQIRKQIITASEVYRASMEWKRSIHRKYQTTMIECYAYKKFSYMCMENLTLK